MFKVPGCINYNTLRYFIDTSIEKLLLKINYDNFELHEYDLKKNERDKEKEYHVLLVPNKLNSTNNKKSCAK